MSDRRTALQPFTRLVLSVSAIVQIVFGLVPLLSTDLWNRIYWTAPLPPWPTETMRFASLTYLATALAALYALWQGSWAGAKVYFAFSVPYVVMSVVAAVWTAFDPGVPPIMWLYVGLSALYLPAVVVAWRQQAASRPGHGAS